MVDKGIIKKLQAALGLSRKIVGVRLLNSPETYRKFPAKPARQRLSYCMMVNLAAAGRSLKAENKHFKCEGSKRALGLIDIDEHVRSGRHYFGLGLYESNGRAKEVASDMAFLNHAIHGLATFPLEEAQETPDTILIICSPYNAMRIIQGYAYHFGITPSIRLVGNQGLCSELTARPLLNNDINLSLLCSGTRFSCKWKDKELGIGMPFQMFPEVIDGIIKTINTTEPDKRKADIIRRAGNLGLEMEVTMGTNYYRSEPGVEKLSKIGS